MESDENTSQGHVGEAEFRNEVKVPLDSTTQDHYLPVLHIKKKTLGEKVRDKP